MSVPDSTASIRLAGIDFTSRPSRKKPITVAWGRLEASNEGVGKAASTPAATAGAGWSAAAHDAAGSIDAVDSRATPTAVAVPVRATLPGASGAVVLDRIDTHADFASFARWLASPGPWLGVFDLPFGLPRELVETLGWPRDWLPLIRHYAALSRAEIRATFAAFCDSRPAGSKFAHRAADRPARSSPSMKWVNPPVAFMLHAGVPLLVDAGLHLPGLHRGDPDRVGLEGYPALLAREILGARSYKSDDRARQTPERTEARRALVDALDAGRTRLGVRLVAESTERDALIGDDSGDRVDAVLCLMQAAWASRRPNHGLPDGIDPLEGWIVTAPCEGLT